MLPFDGWGCYGDRRSCWSGGSTNRVLTNDRECISSVIASRPCFPQGSPFNDEAVRQREEWSKVSTKIEDTLRRHEVSQGKVKGREGGGTIFQLTFAIRVDTKSPRSTTFIVFLKRASTAGLVKRRADWHVSKMNRR